MGLLEKDRRGGGAALALLIAFMTCAMPASAQTRLRVVESVTGDGLATPEWLDILRERLSSAEYDSARVIHRTIAPQELAWQILIRSRTAAWESAIAEVAAPYRPITLPDTITIVLGNRAASDAFTHDERTIGFDLSALIREYRDADDDENDERIDRLFRHELAHIMQRAWLASHPYPLDTPLRLALVEIWKEGLGNHHSLSARWRTTPTGDSPAAAAALEALQPRFVARIAALGCSSPEDAARLTADLSRGRFDHKWGALTAALWLDRELNHDPMALRDFIRAGPDGVWSLAERQLPPSLAHVLREARVAATRCGVR
jgi:hypothetical protein